MLRDPACFEPWNVIKTYRELQDADSPSPSRPLASFKVVSLSISCSGEIGLPFGIWDSHIGSKYTFNGEKFWCTVIASIMEDVQKNNYLSLVCEKTRLRNSDKRAIWIFLIFNFSLSLSVSLSAYNWYVSWRERVCVRLCVCVAAADIQPSVSVFVVSLC